MIYDITQWNNKITSIFETINALHLQHTKQNEATKRHDWAGFQYFKSVPVTTFRTLFTQYRCNSKQKGSIHRQPIPTYGIYLTNLPLRYTRIDFSTDIML